MANPISPLRNEGISRILRDSWNYYKQSMIEEEGRPRAEEDRMDLDFDGNQKEAVTFSETAAYVLLRAVWMDDQPTFDKVWKWTQNNLQRKNIQDTWTCSAEDRRGRCTNWVKGWFRPGQPIPEGYGDHLFAWRYVPSLNGSHTPGGIIAYESLVGIDRNGYNAASDDIEIAVALYFASLRGWGEEYQTQAKLILQDAWEKYVVKVGDEYYLFAGDQFSGSGEINPSYLRPAYFRQLFPAIDPEHPWYMVAQSSYQVINQSGGLKLAGRQGVKLPPNWLAMNHHGELTGSKAFRGSAGEIFGWDAFRVLYAVAQDYAWFGDENAHAYLTSCKLGPLCFLQRKLSPQGKLPSGLHHNGAAVRAGRRIPQTWGLDREQLAMYGAYLPYFYYAGKGEAADKILNRLRGLYHPRGYWGKNPTDYYNQNWVWFGLMLVNGLPPELQSKIQALPIPTEIVEKPAKELPKPLPLQLDPRLGRAHTELGPKLSRELMRKRLSLKQMEETLSAIAQAPYRSLDYDPKINKDYPQFQEINRIDRESKEYHLLGYFADFREYWNNAILLLSAFSQKLIEKNDKQGFGKALAFCQNFRKRVNLETKLEFTPHSYTQAILDLTEAGLRTQVTRQEISFYQEGIERAYSAIREMLGVDPKLARPDYYMIISALLAIGNLYFRMQEVSRQTPQNLTYLEKAGAFFNYVVQIESGATIAIEDASLRFTLSEAVIKETLQFNLRKGHLSEEELEKAHQAIHYLKGRALAQKASLFIRQKGEKSIKNILTEIEKCDQAQKELKIGAATPEDFFIYFAKLLKADLLLFLADRVKFYLWPSVTSDLGSIENELSSLESLLSLPQRDYGRLSRTGKIIKRILDLNQHITRLAKELYQAIPSRFGYLYAASQTKITEAAARNAEFMDQEFRYLVPFYTHPALKGNPIPEDEFLGVELNYLKALLLASTELKPNIKEAKILLEKVIRHARLLDKPYSTYFQIHAQLKMAEILSREKKYRAAFALMAEIENQLKTLTGLGLEELVSADLTRHENLKEMAWRPFSFYAELYHERANALVAVGDRRNARGSAEKALEMCYLSDSGYDYVTRRKIIVRNFNLRESDRLLQARYRRNSHEH